MTHRIRHDALPPPPPSDICKALQIDHVEIEWLAGDGSDRCYYRIRSPELRQPVVLMQLSGSDAIALNDGRYDWIEIGKLLHKHQIPVPDLVAVMPSHAALIIEDYGNTMLETEVTALWRNGDNEGIEHHYEHCLQTLRRFLGIPKVAPHAWLSRKFDAERLDWELRFFADYYLRPVLNWEFSEAESAQFDHDVMAISAELALGETYFVHRDFHSRNIMIRNGKKAIIDFQDARLGPATYDLVSLAFDAYVPLDLPSRLALLERGLDQISTVTREDRETLSAQWQPMLLQRQLKAIGSFGYLTIRKNRGDYLNYVRPALNLLLAVNVFDERWPFLSKILLQRMDQLVK